MVKKILKIFWFTALAIAVLIYAGILLMQTPRVQTFMTRLAAEFVSDNFIDADIRLGKILIKPFNTIILRNVTVVDRNPYLVDTDTLSIKEDIEKFRKIGNTPVDTLFSARDIVVGFSLRGLLGGSMEFDRAYISNAVFNLVLEDGKSSTNLTRMFRISKKNKESSGKEIFHLKSVELDSIRFTMKNYTSGGPESPERGIDWNDLDVRDISIRGRHLRMVGKVMSGELDRLSFKEKSGYVCHSISGRTKTGAGQSIIEDLRLSDPWSNIYIREFDMLYESEEDFSEYVDKVTMAGEIDSARVSFKTLSYFVPSLSGNSLTLDIEGSVRGTVNDFDVRHIHFSTPNGNLSGNIKGHISDMIEPERMDMDLDMTGFRFTTREMEKLIESFAPGTDTGLGKYASGKMFNMDATMKGQLNSLNVKADIGSRIGAVNTDINLYNLIASGKPVGIRGVLQTDDLVLQGFLPGIPVRECSLVTGVNAELGTDINVSIDSLKISRLNFNGYDYKGIAAAGVLSGNRFDGKVICNDPNLNFLFQGIFSFPSKESNALYRFYANIGYADLYALNIDKRGRSKIRLQTSANFTGKPSGDILGDIDVANIILEHNSSKYDIGNIKISSYTGNGQYRIRLASGFAEGQYTGTAPITSFIRDVQDITVKKEIPALFEDPVFQWEGETYNLSFRTLKTMDLLSFLAPGMYIAENSTIDISVNPQGELTGKMKSQRVAYNEHYIKDAELDMDNRNGNISGRLSSGSINAASFILQNNIIDIFADENHVGIGFSYENNGDLENKGEIISICDISREEDGQLLYRIEVLPSSIYLNSDEWNIYQSEAAVKGKDISIRNIELRSGEQSITATGGMSQDKGDTLTVNMNSFDLSIFNNLIKKNLDLKGKATGQAMITSPASQRGLLVDFICDSTSIGGTKVGNISIASRWNQNYKRFDILLSNDVYGKKTINLSGNYSPSLNRLEMTAGLDSIDIGFVRPFLEDIFTDISGHISGNITAEGPLDNLDISSSNTSIDDAYLKIGYTNVGYSVKGPFHIDNLGVYFDDIVLSDRHGNTGKVTGKIGYDHFRNINFDTRIDVNRIEAIDLTEKESDIFYGHLFATGNVSITGPLSSILLSADASTSRAGNIHIPIPSSLNAGSTDLLKFKEEEKFEEIDPYEEMMNRMKKQKALSSDFALKLRVSTNPEVEAHVEIDKASGNTLSGRGTGTIELDLRPSTETFDIKGDYTISSGNVHFVALGIAARDFIIDEGSSIRFNGDIMESTLNIGATYRTKASLSTLIADTASVANRRVVECGIRITEKISNPRLSFSINIPDIDPMVKARVESALSTEDKVQKQFLSLLLTNSFLPDEQSGIVNNSSMLYSNMTEIMASQLNNIFQKLNIPLDLGLSYQQNNRGYNIFDVAVSTQLFNNRVVVNGNIGNRQYRTSGSGSDVVGDIDIEIKLDRPGALRLNLFSHSADQYSNYLDNSQRNGVGLTYQQEFNKFSQFVKLLFASRKKKEEAEFEAVKAAQNEEKVRIQIEAKDKNRKR